MGARNRCLTLAEERALRAVLSRRADGLRDWAVFRALLTTGMRIGEFLSLSLCEAKLALSFGHLFLPASRRKGGDARGCNLKVLMVGEAKDAFEDLVRLAGRPADGDGGPLVQGYQGRRLSVRAFELRLKGWAKEAGVDDRLSPHWLRHTFAAEFCRKSEASPMETCIRLANRLGHTNPQTCSHYLTMSREDDPAKALERVWPSRKRVTMAAARRAFAGGAA